MAEKHIVLSVAGEDLAFVVTTREYNTFVNEMKPDDKVSPAIRFLRRALAEPALRDRLDELCDSGLAVDLAGLLVEEFRPKLEIEVKKSPRG